MSKINAKNPNCIGQIGHRQIHPKDLLHNMTAATSFYNCRGFTNKSRIVPFPKQIDPTVNQNYTIKRPVSSHPPSAGPGTGVHKSESS